MRFDSILVRLKGTRLDERVRICFSFDSILVRLKVPRGVYPIHIKVCFDSILVRLKEILMSAIPTNRAKFRFHTGSIKSKNRHKRAIAKRKFRFHTGSIKSNNVTCDNARRICFDSILVRLKVDPPRFRYCGLYQFRFHTGSIKSFIPRKSLCRSACFDSILVRLKVLGLMRI